MVTSGAGVARCRVDVAVAAGSRVHIDGWVNGEGINGVLEEEPIGFDEGDEKDAGAVCTHHECAGVWLSIARFNHHWGGDCSDSEDREVWPA